MKSSKAKFLATAMMLGAFAQTSQKEYYEEEKHFNKEPKKPIIPKGCKEYHFTRSGRFDTTENMWNDIHYVFSCYASNEKNAIKKFEKFLTQSKS